jgi:hypothetical protein
MDGNVDKVIFYLQDFEAKGQEQWWIEKIKITWGGSSGVALFVQRSLLSLSPRRCRKSELGRAAGKQADA